MKYRVTIVQTVYEQATMDVEADDESAAERYVARLLEKTNEFEYRFCDVASPAEVVYVEELPEGKVINLMAALRATMED